MLKKNIGTIDRTLRIVVGLALLAGFVLNADASLRWLYLIGIVPLATGLVGSCGVYTLLGINTCTVKRS